MENLLEWGDGGRGRRVVVIGGGVAGSLIAKSLQFDADLTLIDPATVEPLFAERSLIHHKDYLANGRLIVSEVTNITNKEVLTADGHQVTYDYLVVATGHYGPLPVTRTDRLEEYQTENEKIKEADSILIVGGGPTGVELAAEIFLRRRNIFAVGDITDIKELKQGYSAQKHTLVAAKNLKLLMSGGKESKLAIYEPRPSAKIIVSLGRQDAVAQFSFTTIIGLVPGMIKSKDLYVGKTRKKMGLQPK
ncbi:hypothetical protein MTR67_049654 [Solanum verrucosum]|uniref:FAD/NAD(P)-binding domain-containing protein n=1 Tax=Solanum verrucosum TaxID=315347 RepID=A0AAF1A188_SOLVR|nr:hypothetical protein MTR67_049654 [Solanum verrucosum]